MTTEGSAKSIQARIEALGLNNNDNRKSMAPPTNPVAAPMQPRVVQLTKKSHTAGEITSQSPVNENGSEKHLPLPPPPRGTSRLSVQPNNTTTAAKPVVHYRTTLPPPPKTPTSQPSSPQPAADASSPVANATSPQPTSESPEPASNVRKSMQGPPIPPRRTASDLGQQQPQVVLKKKPVVKPPPPVPRGPKPLMSTEISKETHQALQQEIEKEEEKKGFVQYVPPAQVAEEKVVEQISASDQLLKEQFAKKYEAPTPQEIQAAITLEKYYRSRLARKTVSRRKKNLFHRENCAKEILSTEETYVHNLKVLVEVYLKPLREIAAQPNPIISKEHVSTIFSDVEVIVGFNSHFLDQLRERISHFNRYTKIGDIILGMAPFFKTYTRYCNNFDRSSDILKECRKNEELRVALQQMDKDPRTTKLGLSSYLILPIQRIPRYRLLLQDYIKHMETDHKDYVEVGVALKKICESADHLNATMRSIDSTTVIIKIQELFSPEIKLLEAHRRLLKEGPVADNFGNKMYIHLFNDIFLFSKRKEKNFERKAETDLTNSVVFDYIGESDTRFKLQSPEGEFILLAATPEEKKEWLAAIHSAIEAKRASKKQTINVDLQAMQDDSSTTFALAMSNDQEDIQIDDETCVRLLKQGDALLKICRASRPHFRKFILSQDETKLMWGSPNKNKTEAVVPLFEVKKILVGQKTALFQKNKNPEYEGLSFSLLYRDRTLDLVCKDKRQFITWVQGLTFLLSRQASGETGTTVSTANSSSDNSDAELIADLRKEKKKFKEQFERIGDSYTWGQGAKGALGHGDQNDQFEPLVMKDFLYLDVEAMAAENSAGVALMTTGEVFTWGSGQAGRLGHGDESDRLKPTFIKSLQSKKIAKITMGNLHTMCIEDTGIVWAFGSNEFGQLGLGSELVGKNQNKPTIVSLLKTLRPIDVQCGQWHSAAISESGQLLTWGRGEDGQLGHGDKQNKSVPTVVYVLSEIKTIECALGLWHSMALTADGRVYSWGNATYGQLGHGNTELSLIPKEIAALTGKKIIQIAAGSAHSACITATGEIYSWGNGIYGQIGDGRKEHCYTPTLVHSLRTERCKQISCGINHTIALMHSGKTFSWGAGTYGRLGLKSENDEPIPQQIPLLADKVVRQVYAGGSQSCAVCAHQWVPDKDAVACMQCKTKFTFFNRRHHCRYCGGIFCNSCTSKRIMLLRFGFEGAVRVCDNCYQILSKR